LCGPIRSELSGALAYFSPAAVAAPLPASQAHALTLTAAGDRISTVLLIGLDDDIAFQRGDRLTWSEDHT